MNRLEATRARERTKRSRLSAMEHLGSLALLAFIVPQLLSKMGDPVAAYFAAATVVAVLGVRRPRAFRRDVGRSGELPHPLWSRARGGGPRYERRPSSLSMTFGGAGGRAARRASSSLRNLSHDAPAADARVSASASR